MYFCIIRNVSQHFSRYTTDTCRRRDLSVSLCQWDINTQKNLKHATEFMLIVMRNVDSVRPFAFACWWWRDNERRTRMMREFVSCICKLRSWSIRFLCSVSFACCIGCFFFKVNILCMHLELHSNCIARAKQKQMRTFIAHTLLSTLIRYKICVPTVFLHDLFNHLCVMKCALYATHATHSTLYRECNLTFHVQRTQLNFNWNSCVSVLSIWNSTNGQRRRLVSPIGISNAALG